MPLKEKINHFLQDYFLDNTMSKILIQKNTSKQLDGGINLKIYGKHD
jgi:hypothetical protein